MRFRKTVSDRLHICDPTTLMDDKTAATLDHHKKEIDTKIARGDKATEYGGDRTTDTIVPWHKKKIMKKTLKKTQKNTLKKTLKETLEVEKNHTPAINMTKPTMKHEPLKDEPHFNFRPQA